MGMPERRVEEEGYEQEQQGRIEREPAGTSEPMADTREGLSTADIAGSRADAGRTVTGDQADVAGETGQPAHPDTRANATSEDGDRAGAGEGEAEPLLPAGEAGAFRARWESIQAEFVDQPRRSVEGADLLVAEVMQRLAQGFSQARSDLEGRWDRGGDVSTEDLRVTLQRYRSFFQRLLAA
jgi:hypothetical protein